MSNENTPASEITINYVNNQGSGFMEPTKVRDGTSLGQFFAAKLPGQDNANFTIRVNRMGESAGYLLKDGDRVSFTSKNIKGNEDALEAFDANDTGFRV